MSANGILTSLRRGAARVRSIANTPWQFLTTEVTSPLRVAGISILEVRVTLLRPTYRHRRLDFDERLLSGDLDGAADRRLMAGVEVTHGANRNDRNPSEAVALSPVGQRQLIAQLDRIMAAAI